MQEQRERVVLIPCKKLKVDSMPGMGSPPERPSGGSHHAAQVAAAEAGKQAAERGGEPMYSQLDVTLFRWFEEIRRKGGCLNDGMVLSQAAKVRDEMVVGFIAQGAMREADKYKKLKLSHEWLEKVRTRYAIFMRHMARGAADVNGGAPGGEHGLPALRDMPAAPMEKHAEEQSPRESTREGTRELPYSSRQEPGPSKQSNAGGGAEMPDVFDFVKLAHARACAQSLSEFFGDSAPYFSASDVMVMQDILGRLNHMTVISMQRRNGLQSSVRSHDTG